MVSVGWIALGKFKKVVKDNFVHAKIKRSYGIQLKKEKIYMFRV